MSKILGSAVKQAVAEAATKQLSAAGLKVPRGSLKTLFSGATARVSYQVIRNAPEGDFVRHCLIAFPLLSDTAVLTRVEADLIAAMNMHECGHVLFTDSAAATRFKKQSVAFVENNYGCASPEAVVARARAKAHQTLVNGLEDPRIEAAVCGVTPAGQTLFSKLLVWLCGQHTGDRSGLDPTKFVNAPYLLALMGRARLGNSHPETEGLFDSLKEPYRSVYGAALDSLAGASLDVDGTQVVIEAANSFITDWLDKINPRLFDQNNQQQDQQPQQGQGQGQGQDQDQDDQDQDQDQDDQDQDEQDQDGGSADDESDDDESDDDNDWSDDGESDDSESDDSESDDAGSNGSNCLDSEESDENAPDTERVNEQTAYKEPDACAEAGELFRRIGGREGQDGLPTYTPAEVIEDPSNYVKASEFTRAWNPEPAAAGLSASLRRLLTSPDRIGWLNGQCNGRFDSKRFSQLVAGKENVFKKRFEDEGIDTAVSICVDLSGSMEEPGNNRLAPAKLAAYQLAKAVEAARCKVEITGFNDSIYWGFRSYDACEDMFGKSTYADWNDTAHQGASLIVFKPFSKRVDACKNSIRLITRIETGGTPDYQCIRTLFSRMTARPERRKIIFVLTDGFGYPEEMNKLCNYALTKGVLIVGIGIGMNPRNPYEVERFSKSYPIGALCADTKDLSEVAMGSIIKQIRNHKVL